MAGEDTSLDDLASDKRARLEEVRPEEEAGGEGGAKEDKAD